VNHRQLFRSVNLQNGIVPFSFEQKRDNPKRMSVFISNCKYIKNKRLDVLKLMSEYGITFESFGICLRTAVSPDVSESLVKLSNSIPKGYRHKIRASSQYMFTFAAENADCAGYHTEKIYHALAAGSIPVYLGAKTISSVVPSNSYIHYRDFENVSSLVEFMKRVANDRELYESFHEWRMKPIESRLVEVMKGGHMHPQFACDICALAHQRPNHTVPPDLGCHSALGSSYFH
jgi:hypothetical protein